MNDDTALLLLRHGEVYNPKAVLYYRLPGFFLSNRGQDEARAAGAVLAQHRIDRVVHSPMERTWQTARLAMLGRDTPLAVDDLLNEYDRDEALPSLIDRITRFWTAWRNRPHALLAVSHRETLRALLLLAAGHDIAAHIADLETMPLPTAGLYRITAAAPHRVEALFVPHPNDGD